MHPYTVFATVLVLVINVNFTQPRVIWEVETSVEELPPSDGSVKNCIDFEKLIDMGRPSSL